jgi:DNA-binding NarL/FixJ family response regulator
VARIRLLLVDENDDFLDGVSAWLAEDPNVRVAGVAHSGEEAIERAATLAPHIVFVDVRLPDMNGFEAVRRIKAQSGAPLVVLTTFHDTAALRSAALAAGADGCLSKPRFTKDFVGVIEDLLHARKRRVHRADSVVRPT